MRYLHLEYDAPVRRGLRRFFSIVTESPKGECLALQITFPFRGTSHYN
eukprot:jgi/Botrbrau1/448/Bobra.110_2s0095.1